MTNPQNPGQRANAQGEKVQRVERTTTTRKTAPAQRAATPATSASTAYETTDHVGQEAWIGTGSDNVCLLYTSDAADE